MRELKTKDVFNAMRLASEIDLKGVLNQTRIHANEETVGFELIMAIVKNLSTSKAEELFYTFISAPLEMDAEAVKEMDALAFIDLMKELSTVVKADDWIRFFQSVVKTL